MKPLHNNKVLDAIFIAVLSILIALPFIFSNKTGGERSGIENRLLASAPKLYDDTETINTKILIDLENWINDNAGGRKLSTNIVTKSDYYLFGLSAKSDTLIGRNFWTFYYNEDILKDYQQLNIPNEEYIATYTTSLNNINNYSKEKNISFYGFVIPDKKTLYPEYYSPNIIRGGNEKGRSEIMVEAVNELGINFFFAKDIFVTEKNSQDKLLYSPRVDNAHWQSYGAFVGYTFIMDQISKDNPSIISRQVGKDFVLEAGIRKGMFNGAIPVEEEGYFFQPLFTDSVTDDLNFFDSFPNLKFSNFPEAYKKRFVNTNPLNEEKVLLIGDSYSELLWSFMASTFSEVTFLHIADVDHIYTVIDKAKPDIVLYVQAERMFDFSQTAFAKLEDRD